MFVLGTAGHIDHGKSVLVEALTGIDPDRLAEEKARGMTIDLGFAWMKLPSGREVGIIDVPGHERFIRNMLAGVGGIDLALLVVAANEGVMPQTREHLAIIDLLDISTGLVAITKRDLVDDEWLDLVKMEVEEILAPTSLAGADIIPVSAITGDGLPELIATIDRLLESTAARPDRQRGRLPVDRVFTMPGAGTVVTGTLIDGSLSVGDDVEIVPTGLKSRLRGLQVHRSKTDTALPGNRVAANLVGVATEDIHRGDVIARPGWLRPATLLSARLRLLKRNRHPLRHNSRLSVYIGASEAVARVRILEGSNLKAGESGWIQLMLDRPLAVVRGDHFILRNTTDTLGGGRIIDAHARRLRRLRPEIIAALETAELGNADDIVLSAIESAQPTAVSSLAESLDLAASDVAAAVETLLGEGRAVAIGEGEGRRFFTGSGWERLARTAVELAADYHRRFPARGGIPRVEIAGKLGPKAVAQTITAALVARGVLVEEGLNLRLPGHEIKLSAEQQARLDTFRKVLTEKPYAPPAEQIPEPDVLNLLLEKGEVIKLAEGVVFSKDAYNRMTSLVTARLEANGKVTLAEVRDLFQTSRKYAQALLEHLDARKLTRRVGDERVLY